MSGARRWAVRALVLVVALGLVRLAGAPLARMHVAHVTGREEVGDIRCWNCHVTRGSILPPEGLPHPDPWWMAASPDGRSLWVACGPIRQVAKIGLGAGDGEAGSGEPSVELSAELPGPPRGLALSPDGARLAVSLGEVDEVALLDPSSLAVNGRISVGVEPAGLAFDRGGGRLFVANSASGDVSIVELGQGPGRESYRVDAGREPFAALRSPDGATVAVVSRMVETDRPTAVPRTEVTLFDAAAGTVRRRVMLASIHQAEAAAFTPDGRFLLVPAIRVRNLLPILQVARGWVMSSVLAVIDVQSGRVAVLPLNEPNVSFPDPSGIAVDPGGERVWVASGGGDQLAELDLPALLEAAAAADPEAPERLTQTRDYLRRRLPVGSNPRALLPVNGSLAVAERLDDRVALFDRDSLALAARVPVGPPVPEDAIRRGDAVFHDASYAFQGAFSCRSCHPGGHTDGLTYDFDIDGVGRNVVLNRSLRGLAGTAPFKWIGLNPTLQRQCGPRFAMVLTRADPFPEDRLEDLVAYLESLPPPRPDPRAGWVGSRNTGAVERGRALFYRETRKTGEPIPPEGRCSTCHAGPHYTNRLKADVGTGTPTDSSGEFDVPHLTGIGSKAPYLHDGRARTLEEIWTTPGVGDHHGVVTDLNKADLNDLVEFLKGL